MIFVLSLVIPVHFVFANTEEALFKFTGILPDSNDTGTLLETSNPSDGSPSFCASLCRAHPQCQLFEICQRNRGYLCRLKEDASPTPTEATPLTNICSNYINPTVIDKCLIGTYDVITDSCIDECAKKSDGSGVLEIDIGGKPVNVLCYKLGTDMWTVIQRRIDGSVSFYRNWKEYKEGFGNASSEYWIGNENIHLLTSNGYTDLRFHFQANDGAWAHEKYKNFYIEDEDHMYRMHVNHVSGTAGDSFSYHDKAGFSTYDNDNDEKTFNCAVERNGAFWYKHCYEANLNGLYGEMNTNGIIWISWKGKFSSLKSVIMMIKKRKVH